jgi:hypothetical protein
LHGIVAFSFDGHVTAGAAVGHAVPAIAFPG